jgi:hypothetical protein
MAMTTAIGFEILEAIKRNYKDPNSILDKFSHGCLRCDCCGLEYGRLDFFAGPNEISKIPSEFASINNRLKIRMRFFGPYGREPRLLYLLAINRFKKDGFANLLVYLKSIYGKELADLIFDDGKDILVYTLNCKDCIEFNDDDFFYIMQMREKIEPMIKGLYE